MNKDIKPSSAQEPEGEKYPLGVIYTETSIEENPEQEGWYMTRWKGVPAFTEKEWKGGEWQSRFNTSGLMVSWLKPSLSSKEQGSAPAEWIDTSISAMHLQLGRLEVNCFNEDSEMSIRVGKSSYESLTVDEAKELASFIVSHIKNETEANQSPSKPAELKKEQEGEVEKLRTGIRSFIEWLKKRRPTMAGTGAPIAILEDLLGDNVLEAQTREAEDIESLKGTLEVYKGEIKVVAEQLEGAIADYNAAQSEIDELRKIAAGFDSLAYQEIMWLTHNSQKRPEFQAWHDAMDTYNEYSKKHNL
jgi:hypothetical protein